MTNTSAAHEVNTYPVLPLRDIVVFPHMIVPLFVGREKSIRALEEVMGSDKQIMLATQINASDDDPAPDAIYEVGTVANVLQLLKLPDGTVKVLIEGRARAKVESYTGREDYYEAKASILAHNRRGQSGLWGYGISGDLPIVLVRIRDHERIELVLHRDLGQIAAELGQQRRVVVTINRFRNLGEVWHRQFQDFRIMPSRKC